MIDTETEEWVKIALFDKNKDIRFTPEYLELTKELGGERRRLAAFLISHWDQSLGSMLDYFGPDELEVDLYTGIDGEAMDVRDDIPDLWEYKEIPIAGLSAEFYKDIMRAKLVTLSLPVKCVTQYIKAFNKERIKDE